MVRGFYAAASGMVAQMARQDGYAGNLANASTVGYRRVQTAVRQFPQELAAQAAGGLEVQAAGLDSAPGALTQTARPLDFALSGDAYFTVQTPRGLAYSRDGRCQLDAQRRLVNAQGYPLLGQRGPLTLPAGEVTVTAAGVVSCGGQPVDTLRLVSLTGPRALGQGLYAGTARAATGAAVHQGALEQSNVNAIQEMGRMLNGYRLYEANATALRFQDQSLTSLYQVVE